jgi:hypothetical protein
MKKVLLLILLFSSSAFANEGLKQLSFLEGCWKGVIEDSVVYESWGNGDGQMMLGTSKTVSKGAIESFEFLSILSSEGEIRYVPYVNGKKSVSFPMSRNDGTMVEFSNPSHDFPKVIRYETGKDKLSIRLTGDGPNIEYALNRTSCSQ